MEKRKIDAAELDMEVQGHGPFSSGCTTSGKSTDCCWHDCKVWKEDTALFTYTGLAKCQAWATYSWSAFS